MNSVLQVFKKKGRFFGGLGKPPIVSIVVPCLGVPFGILNIKLVKPKKGTTMETLGLNRRREPNHDWNRTLLATLMDSRLRAAALQGPEV